jgi:hypothetical protein
MAADSPLHATYWRIAAPRGSTELSAATDRAPVDGPGWLRLEDLLRDDAAFEALVTAIAREWRTDRRDIAGAGWLSELGFALALRGAAAFLAERRVPDLAATGNAAVRLHPGGLWVEAVALESRFLCLPDDPRAGSLHAVVVTDERVLLRRLLEGFEVHQERVVERVAERCRRPRAALWRHCGDTVAEAFMWAGELLDDRVEAWSWGMRALEDAPKRLQSSCGYSHFRHAGVEQVGRVRAQCCLNYRTEDATYCFSCPLKGEDHRRRVLERRAAEEAAA